MIRRKLLLLLCVACGLAGAAIVASVATGTAKLYSIPTGGMSPTIQAGDRIFATAILKPERSVKRGDVVVFRAEKAHASLSGRYVQRVVALGGDKVEVTDGELMVNGARLPERGGLRPTPAKERDPRFPGPSYPLLVPAGSIFTLGDNHGNSLDSRYFGPFPIDAVTHSADRIVYPPSRAGEVK
jgi:signal peptidase I